jgi:hypothetical protein
LDITIRRTTLNIMNLLAIIMPAIFAGGLYLMREGSTPSTPYNVRQSRNKGYQLAIGLMISGLTPTIAILLLPVPENVQTSLQLFWIISILWVFPQIMNTKQRGV